MHHFCSYSIIIGLPSVITTDQGKEFSNNLNTELMKEFNIQHRLTTPYHPQANGLDERYNQTLIKSLAKFSQENRETWDIKLEAVVYGYNTAVQVSHDTFIEFNHSTLQFKDSSKFTPFEAMFGKILSSHMERNRKRRKTLSPLVIVFICALYSDCFVLTFFSELLHLHKGSILIASH